MQNPDYWVNLLRDMSMSWVVVQSDSDSFYQSGAAEVLLQNQIIPIVRFWYLLPDPWTQMESIDQLVNLYQRYDVPCIIQFSNEPYDSRSWQNGEVPPVDEMWQIVADRWSEAARIITERGAYAGFPDGPGYTENPFERTQQADWVWHEGKGIFLTHNYGKCRPVDYPFDDVSQHGTPLTVEEYRAALDDYADDPDWNELIHNPAFLDQMNAQRAAWAKPGQTAVDDDTCFLGWHKTLYQASRHFGPSGPTIPLAMTEGGWVPRDRAGSDPVDIRWPMTTPRMVAQKTLAIFEAATPFLAICPWLLADSDLGGAGAWEFDAWVGYPYEDKYGREKPVVQALRDNPPGDGDLNIQEAIEYFELARAEVEDMLSELRV